MSYQLWIDDGQNGDFAEVTEFDQSTNFEITTVQGVALTRGLVYRIKQRAQNVIGFSEFSTIVEAAAVNVPPKVSSIRKVAALSSDSSITVEWDKPFVDAAELPGGRLTHYQLYMDDGLFGNFTLVNTEPTTVRQMTLNALAKGRAYRFKVTAFNYNGAGEFSDSYLFNACANPSHLSAPTLKSTTESTLTLEWSEPLENGGCPITGYYLLRDDGSSGVPSIEVNSPLGASLRD